MHNKGQMDSSEKEDISKLMTRTRQRFLHEKHGSFYDREWASDTTGRIEHRGKSVAETVLNQRP